MSDLVMESVGMPLGSESALVRRAAELSATDGIRARVGRAREQAPDSLVTVIELADSTAAAPAAPAGATVRRYRVLADFVAEGYSPDAAGVLQSVLLDTNDPDQLAAWYADEHMDLLFQVPGWLRCVRGELIEGDGPRYLALHELAAVEVATNPLGDPARSTPWRDRVFATVTDSERELYRLLP